MKNLILLSILSALMSACVVVPAQGYAVAPGAVVVPPPVVVRPYYYGGYYGGYYYGPHHYRGW